MRLRNILGVITVSGGAISLGFSILFAFNGELDKAMLLALYAIASWMKVG